MAIELHLDDRQQRERNEGRHADVCRSCTDLQHCNSINNNNSNMWATRPNILQSIINNRLHLRPLVISDSWGFPFIQSVLPRIFLHACLKEVLSIVNLLASALDGDDSLLRSGMWIVDVDQSARVRSDLLDP